MSFVNLIFDRIITNSENENFRHSYIKSWIKNCKQGSSVLDVGAGSMPYKNYLMEQGLFYSSHDFQLYDGNSATTGLHNPDWPVTGHDLVCDILDLPTADFDYVLCTEVLEHVPDPAKALIALARTLKMGGTAMITVPFSSRMHQAPYWFSAGLSPFWFQKQAENSGFECRKIVVAGDYVDQILSEMPQFLSAYTLFGINIGYRISRVMQSNSNWLRVKLPKDLLESGGLGVYIELTKIRETDTTPTQNSVIRDSE